jgi:hypothetical protein
LSLLTFLDPFDPHAEVVTTDSDLDPYEFRYKCIFHKTGEILGYVMIGYKGVLVVLGVILSFSTRNVAKGFNESKHIGIAISFLL